MAPLAHPRNVWLRGLRVNSAADDAAGLAVRELMRSDITSLNQGVRNANDGISMIQTADGALSVIDEKLIRMKELAEQAATGTYTDDQRMIIDSEYQAMASEITRISNATDFNGIHLLNGNISGEGLTIHFGPGNDAAEDKYNVSIDTCTAEALGVGLASGGAGAAVSTQALAEPPSSSGFGNRVQDSPRQPWLHAEPPLRHHFQSGDSGREPAGS